MTARACETGTPWGVRRPIRTSVAVGLFLGAVEACGGSAHDDDGPLPSSADDRTNSTDEQTDAELKDGRDEPSGAMGTADGSEGFVAYDVLSPEVHRDIYLRSVAGGCDVALLTTSADEKQPAISPDGASVLYVSNGSGLHQIHLLERETGETHQLTHEELGASYPAWSPDGRRIAYVSADTEDQFNLSAQVVLLDLDTEVRRVLVSDPWGTPTGLAFTDDNELLVGDGLSLIAVELESSAVRDVVPITNRIPNPAFPTLAPSGELFAYSDRCGGGGLQLYVARVDGTTGDTCSQAFALASPDLGLRSASWGPFGMIAVETSTGDIVLIPDDGSPGSGMFIDAPGPARNPSFAPAGLVLGEHEQCEMP